MITKKISHAIAALSFIALTACTAMDEQQCRSTDWQQRGISDAERGLKEQTIERYAQACQEFGVKADAEAYQKGWNAGIQNFCTRENGWAKGLSTHASSYSHSCPQELEAEFYSAYQLGRAVKEARREVENTRGELDDVLDDLAEQSLTEAQRTQLKKKRKHLEKELSSAKWREKRAASEARKMGFAI